MCLCVQSFACVCLGANMSVCVNGQSLQLIALSVASPGGRCHRGHLKTNDLNVNLSPISSFHISALLIIEIHSKL